MFHTSRKAIIAPEDPFIHNASKHKPVAFG